jgi:hypothetical protein
MERLSFLLQTMGPSLPFELNKILLIQLVELQKLPDLAKALREYQPQPDPLAQEKVQAEIDYIRANTQKDMTAAEKNIADSVLKQSKAGNEETKARLTNSEADQLDLDYLEQATGLKQDRFLEQLLVKQQAVKPQNFS